MSYTGLSTAKSFLECAKKIEAEFAHADSLVLLNGDSLSGRTSLCEQLINALDGRYTTVFIPCKDDSSLENLRVLVLQQISQGKTFDSSKPLWQAFNELSVPVREKFLIVADDLDSAIDDFVEELFELFKKYLGSNRFSMLLTAHPLWAETKMAKLSGRIGYVQYAVPSLSMDETLEISRQIFESANLSRVYKTIESKLPKAYEKCSGNVGKIIKLTEILMSDPIEATSKNTETPVEIKPDVLKKKKRSSSAVFISIICIVIVIACLIPVFLGSNVTEKVFGSNNDAGSESTPTVGKADNSVTVNDTVNNSVSEDPLAVSAGAVTDINAKGPKGDGKNSVSDDGELLPKVSEGIEAETVKATTKNSVTLEGKTLDAIENKEADSDKSDRPRQQLGGTVAKSEKAESAKADAAKDNTVAVLSRQDNILYKDKIEAEDAAIKKRELDEKLAREHALKLEEEQKALAEKTKAEEQKKEAEVKSNETVKKTVRKTNRAPLNVTPIPGAQSELTEKNSRHYTVQVLAGGKKAPLLEVADYIDGRYWIYTTKRGQSTWYVLITGDFLSTGEAVAYIRKLPANLKKAGPFVKSFNKVQTEMRNN